LLHVVAALLLLIASPAFGAVFVVNAGGDGGDPVPGDGVCDNGFGGCSLRAAIDEVNASGIGGDSISIQVPEVTLFFGELVITAPVTISGGGPDVCTVRRNTVGGFTPEFRIFHVLSHGVSISGITIRNGSLSSPDQGSAILNDVIPATTVMNCVISLNTRTAIHGVFNLTDSSISTTTGVGAILIGQSSATNCTFINNTEDGLVVYEDPSQEITFHLAGSTLSGNGQDGLQVAFQSGPVTADGCVFSDNAEAGIFFEGGNDVPSVLTVSNSSITGNGYCGFDFCFPAGIWARGTLFLDNCNVSGNSGSGIEVTEGSSNITVSNSTISNNVSVFDGGGIHDLLSTITVTNSTISGNRPEWRWDRQW
jgi:parallel beta-helix repeat protein